MASSRVKSGKPPTAGPTDWDLFESIPQPAWIYDTDTLRFLEVSRSAVRVYGYTRDEFLAMTLEDIRPPEDVALLRAHMNEVDKESSRMEWTHRKKDGSTFTVQVAGEAVTYRGRPARLVVAIDVTDRVRTTEALRESEENFHRIADHVPAILWSSKPDGQSTWVNRQWLNFRGSTLDAELGHGWMDAVHPEDAGRYTQAMEEAFGSRRPLYFVFRAKDKDGQWRHLLTRGDPYNAPDGSFQGYLGICTDVTEQVKAAEELGRQNELSKTIFDNIPAMIAVLNASGEILTVNHETERVTGYSADELRSRGDVAALLCFDPEAVDGAREFVQRADRTWGEFHLRAKDGTEITAAWANAKLSDGSLIGIGQDVTERKALEGQLRQAQKMESVGRLAGGIAHDFNNLLTAILGFTTLAYRDAPPDGTVRRALDEVRKAAERAASLTRQLLVFSRKQVVVSETVDLCEVVNDTVGMLRRMIGEDVRLHTDVMARDATVRVDRGQIEQVLLNLAVNSRDAMPQGGDLWLQVERLGGAGARSGAGSAGEGGRVVLSVRDSGVGMDENVRSHIFEPFFTTKPLGEGTGLGLATVFGIVQQCGGSIEVDTAPGKGTTFRISIPWQSRHAPAALAEAPGIAASGGHEVVLLVEDEDAVRRLVAAVLEGSGYRVLVTASGEEAFRMASDPECAIDLVLSDLVMPGTNGREVVERLQALRPGLRSLFMSGYTSDVIVRRGIQTGDSPFIQKPFLPATLLAKVRQVLDTASPDTVVGSR